MYQRREQQQRSDTIMKKYKEIPHQQWRKLLYPQPPNVTPFGQKRVIYADFIASGRPSPAIEQYIATHIYGKYSNTHSNAENGIFMKDNIHLVRDIVKREYGIGDDYEILFKGSGCTAAVNHLIDSLELTPYTRVHIFISAYEHYSNHLPWLELAKAHPSKIHIHIIPLTEQHELDLEWFENLLQKLVAAAIPKSQQQKHLWITSIIHCSNLFGYFTPIEHIKTLLDGFRRRHPHITQHLFCDLACSAPYVHVNGNLFDAFFLSPHKFIGGVETPGLLVAKTALFQKDHPTEPGGSCIQKTHYNDIEYAHDIETRESAGTPNIIGIIKIGLCLQLKQEYQHTIAHNEHLLVQTMRTWSRYFQQTYPTRYQCIEYPPNVKQLPIFAFSISGMHYNLVVVLLNDLFGIQSRGGRACDGLLSDYVKDKYGIDGFCRISLHWTMDKKSVTKIFRAIEYLLKRGDTYKPLYQYNEKENLFHYTDSSKTKTK